MLKVGVLVSSWCPSMKYLGWFRLQNWGIYRRHSVSSPGPFPSRITSFVARCNNPLDRKYREYS